VSGHRTHRSNRTRKLSTHSDKWSVGAAKVGAGFSDEAAAHAYRVTQDSARQARDRNRPSGIFFNEPQAVEEEPY
jgi:hypothetical protein